MTIRAIKCLAPSWWFPESEENEVDRCEFLLESLNQMDFFHAMTLGSQKLTLGGAIVFVPNQEGVRFILRRGLKGWQNFLDADENPVEFAFGKFETIPVTIIQDLLAEILERSTVSEALKKS
jgi:hypothetical protein